MLNDGKSNRVAVIGGSRIPFCRANTGYKDSSNQEMMTATLKAIVKKYHLQGKRLGDVALGAVIKHSSDWNLSRECVIDSGLSINTPGVDMQRACGTSLETTLNIANKIALGQIEAGIAGGVDSISDAPIVYNDSFRKILLASVQGKSIKEKIQPWLRMKLRFLKPKLPGVKEPRTGLSMGESTEIIAKKYHISRQSQDELALESHINTAKAYDEGFYQNLVHPFKGIHEDNIMRRNIAIDKLKLLKTVFDKSEQGSMTPGNSTSLTDGAAAVLLSSEEWAHNNNLRIEAYLTHCEIAAIDYINDEGLLMAPAYAVSSMLRKANLTLQDFDFYEIHEAFAAQTLATLKAWESIDFCRSKLNRDIVMGSIDSSKLNIKGGSLAIGHPFAATGARIIATMAKLLNEKGSGRGLISICTAGGMGITAIMEK
jgi:acetyl-CoA C-acetyltransferase